MGPYSSAVDGGPAVTHFAAQSQTFSAHSPQTVNWINPTNCNPVTWDCKLFSNYNAPATNGEAYQIQLFQGVYTCTYSFTFPYVVASTTIEVLPPNLLQNYWRAICRLTAVGAGFEAEYHNYSTQCIVPPANGWQLVQAYDLFPQGCNGAITGYSWNAGTFTLSQP